MSLEFTSAGAPAAAEPAALRLNLIARAAGDSVSHIRDADRKNSAFSPNAIARACC
jgi:hypothetical protein